MTDRPSRIADLAFFVLLALLVFGPPLLIIMHGGMAPDVVVR